MKKIFFAIVVILSFSPKSKSANWQRAKMGGTCTATYVMNMREIERTDAKKIKVSQNSLGFAAKGYIELNASSSKKDLPIFGEFLDIFVEKIKTSDGYDYWRECTPKD